MLPVHVHRDWEDASLTSAVDWLLGQCGRTQTECRHTCMQLVYNLSPCLPGLLLFTDFFVIFCVFCMLKGFRGYRYPKSGVSHWLWSSPPQQCYYCATLWYMFLSLAICHRVFTCTFCMFAVLTGSIFCDYILTYFVLKMRTEVIICCELCL